MRDRMIMTPGPTAIHEDVRYAMAKKITNPDLDPDFYEFYKKTTEAIASLMNTKNEVLILCGEGILGLEAACASLIQKGDKVLCIDNGIYGRGFGDFVEMYGGECTYFEGNYRESIDVMALEEFLKENNDFKFATFVHCETPSAILNDAKRIGRLLNKYNIISIVDAVSSIGAEELYVDEWNLDIVIGGSQKCLSAPPGLTFMSISEKAWNVIENRETKIAGYYCNLGVWKGWYEKQWFPYTQPISDIYALKKAVDRNLDDVNIIKRHERIAEAVRVSIEKAGLEIYPRRGFSNAVTALILPENINPKDVRKEMVERHNIMIAGSFGEMENAVIRIGHMGENCKEENVFMVLKALDDVLKNSGVDLKSNMHNEYEKVLDKAF